METIDEIIEIMHSPSSSGSAILWVDSNSMHYQSKKFRVLPKRKNKPFSMDLE